MKTIKLMYVPLLVNFVIIIETTAEPCSTADHLPVVNICLKATAIQDSADTVLIKADSRQNCTCELSINNQNQSIKVNIERFDNQRSSRPSNNDCGLILKFDIRQDIFWEANCLIDNNLSKLIKENDVVTIRSWTVTGTLKSKEGYCMAITKATHNGGGNELNITCGIGSSVTATTTTQPTETTTKMTTTKDSLPITTTTVPTTSTTTSTTTAATTTIKTTKTAATTTTTKTAAATTTKTAAAATTTTTTTTTAATTIDTNEFTTATITSSDGSGSTKQAKQQPISKDNDETTVLAAGASVGGFVTIIVIIVLVCIYKRHHQKPTCKPGQAADNDYDDYGLRDNVLYVSSQPTDTTQTQNNADSPKTNRISVDIDGNYSTVDLDEIPPVKESTVDYSSIDLEKLTPSKLNMKGSTNEKPIIAPKPKQKMIIQNDVYSVPDKKRVKHVAVPGENGCEYAVVSKPNKSNVDKVEDQPSTSNVYAVVEKMKRMSDGKGTNQKRDSLTAENDGETGQL